MHVYALLEYAVLCFDSPDKAAVSEEPGVEDAFDFYVDKLKNIPDGATIVKVRLSDWVHYQSTSLL